ncbi:MAG: A/G-specific adenine glycosylase [Blautia sp.]|nr:A/G-specific adenine glycosylase [Blautia sp.]
MKSFAPLLIEWYHRNKRSLPWRGQHQAYYTWVSEIMLQQTRVEAVKPYFLRFVEELPDVFALADCDPDRLLKLWEGLGYYSRVKNMQEAAKTITTEYHGVIPDSFDALLKLKGIGRYTAAAIASIAYGEKAACVDGNVLRVFMRLTENPADIRKAAVKREVEKELEEMMPAEAPGDFNQAMMELGALICVPNGLPKCGECPLRRQCLAFLHDTVSLYPGKTAAKEREKEDRTILILQDEEGTAVRKRPPGVVLAGLYEPVNIPGHLSEQEVQAWAERAGLHPIEIEALPASRHVFTHLEWRMKAYRIRVGTLEGIENKEVPALVRMKKEEYAIPSAFRAYKDMIY